MAVSVSAKPRGMSAILGWPRVRFTLIVSTVFGLLFSIASETATVIWIFRAVLVGLMSMLAFGVLEQWPAREPRRMARWVMQLLAIVLVIPLAALLAYLLTTGGDPNFSEEPKRVIGFAQLTFTGILVAPWLALGAMLRQREAFVREQALAFELERSEFERKALDARLRLLQAQVEPHFLFNTLANVQALVDAGSPHASCGLTSTSCRCACRIASSSGCGSMRRR
jgi:hypothetical protein